MAAPTSLLQLPHDILSVIVSHCDILSLPSVAAACSTLRAIIIDNTFVDAVLLRHLTAYEWQTNQLQLDDPQRVAQLRPRAIWPSRSFTPLQEVLFQHMAWFGATNDGEQFWEGDSLLTTYTFLHDDSQNIRHVQFRANITDRFFLCTASDEWYTVTSDDIAPTSAADVSTIVHQPAYGHHSTVSTGGVSERMNYARQLRPCGWSTCGGADEVGPPTVPGWTITRAHPTYHEWQETHSTGSGDTYHEQMQDVAGSKYTSAALPWTVHILDNGSVRVLRGDFAVGISWSSSEELAYLRSLMHS